MHLRVAQRHRIAAAAFFFICGCTFASWAIEIPAIKLRFGLNEAQLGALLFLLPLGSLSALPFAGWVVNRYGSRQVLLISAVLYAGLLLLIGHSNHVWQLGSVLFFFGFWGDTLNIAMNTQALQVQSAFYSRSLMSSFHGMWSLGAMAGAALGGFLSGIGFSTLQHFYMVAVLLLILTLLFYKKLLGNEKPAPGHTLFAWPDRTLWLLGAICFCCTVCEGAMADWSSLYYQQLSLQVEKAASSGYTAYAFCMASGRLLGDAITERLGYKGTLKMDALLISTGLGLAIGFPHPIIVILGFGLVGIGVATIIPIVYTLAWKNSRMPVSAALAAVSTVGFSGFLVGPPVIGFLAHLFTLRMALLLICVLAFVILFLSGRVKA